MSIARLEFDSLPGLPAQYLKALAKSARPGGEVPRIEAQVANVRLDPARLAAYRRVCGFLEADTVPLTFPQVLAAPLHAAMMVRPEFPFALLGMVHVRQRIRQLAPLRVGEPLTLTCRLDGAREARSGREFDLVTTFESASARWEGLTTVLVRTGTAPKVARSERRAEPPGEPAGASRSTVWRLPEDLGRRYAGVSADWNPIHVSALTAKPFGFPRAIAHGMWSVARGVAELGPEAPQTAELTVEFRRPVLLPSTVFFSTHRRDSTLDFAVRSRDGVTHLSGEIAPAK
jgi:acyl dehydratase